MKKKFLLLALIGSLVVAGCQKTTSPTPQTENFDNEKITLDSVFGVGEAPITYTEKMQQPDFNVMENKQAIQEAEYTKERTREYTLTEEDIQSLQLQSCSATGKLIPSNGEGDDANILGEEIVLDQDDMKVGKTFTVKGKYDGINPYPLTGKIIDQIKKYGFGIMPLDGAEHFPDYRSEYGIFGEEEWVNRTSKIGGSREAHQRYPFNTLLVTNDLLLHTFHKVFSNELQYFEETEARPIISELSKEMFTLFVEKAKKDQKEVDKFLAAYRSIPYALLPSNEELNKMLDQQIQLNIEQGVDLSIGVSDETLKEALTARLEGAVKQLDPSYQAPVQEAREKLREAQSLGTPLIASYSSYPREFGIKQDYTQFKPRAHYTNSLFLKTYFRTMKRFMREKFYFGDPKLVEATLHMTQNLSEASYQKLQYLQEAILTLIGTDDDVNIKDIKDFIDQERIKEYQELSKEQLAQITKLRAQKIISTPYSTENQKIQEQEAKDATIGFVFFGEKFTLDSYIFDLLTAGKVEKEAKEKPSIHTAFIVPDVLEGYSPATQLVKLWLEKKVALHLVIEDGKEYTQISSYPEKKKEAKEKIKTELADGVLLKTVYHNRLKLLGQLFVEVKNAPYFKTSPLYILKNLGTYMGSYTELKHDTLLYVKQSYAELGGGYREPCGIAVLPPELPVPKGYIEADVNFIDKLIALNKQTKERFKDADTFNHFEDYLKKIRKISLQQMKNEKISDTDFEWLRLSYQELAEITKPRKAFGEAGQKEERGALIADIFTASGPDPLYEAVGRPMLMALMVKDANGARIVLGPIFSHYEFYGADDVIPGVEGRYTDEDWQANYDNLDTEVRNASYGVATQELLKGINQ